MFFSLITFAFLYLPFHSSTIDNVRIGLFSLFHPHTLTIQSEKNPITLKCDENNKIILSAGAKYRISIHGKEIILLDGNKRLCTAKKTLETIYSDSSSILDNKIKIGVIGNHTSLNRYLFGTLTFSVSKGEIQVVLKQNIEKAVTIITASEMSGVNLVEALKSQSIVIRSFLLANLGRHSINGYDLCDTTHCQLYFGELENNSKFLDNVSSAVSATTGKVIHNLDSMIISAYFTACCGGYTTTPEIAWGNYDDKEKNFKSVTCNWCRNSKFYKWKRTIKRDLLLQSLISVWGKNISEDVLLNINEKSDVDFVKSLILSNKEKKTTITNILFRTLIGKKLGWNIVLSNCYRIIPQGEYYVFEGKGFGHQVGLCMEGAIAQALSGKNYKEILKFYFPNTTINGTKLP